ncbi:carbon-nitrogen hydrolase [Biscogniauxia marginata]|nr:carbon-nitrogen hydrolase [Biscogniauxia marginata]
MSNRIRLATASPGTRATTAETLDQLRGIATRAAAGGADLLLLPEAYLGGYPRGSDFGCVVGARSAAGRDEYLGYFRAAVDLGDTVGVGGAGAGERWVVGGRAVDGKGDGTREVLEGIARDTGVFVVTGLVERAGGSLYCAVVYVCPRKGVVGKRRKVLPTGSERLIWAQGSPATLKAVSTTIRGVRINLAAAICWENYMPLLRQSLYAQNVNLYLAPTADNRDAWLALMRTVALEGRCFVVSSNMCVRAGPGGAEKEIKSAAAGSSNGVLANGGGRVGGGGGPINGASLERRRRSSVLVDDGNEIVLPALPKVHAAASTTTSSSAVVEEDRHEHEHGHERRTDMVPLTNNPFTGTTPAPASATKENKTPAVPAAAAAAAETKEAFLSRGGSSIVSPMGDVLAGPQWEDDEGIIYADVDFEDCVRGRLDLDAAGSYSRNDSFKFSVEGLDLDPLPYW